MDYPTLTASLTYRGPFLTSDFMAIRGLIETAPVAAQIFATGEIKLDRIGQFAVHSLVKANVLMERDGIEPMFVVTDSGTMRMTRYHWTALIEAVPPAFLHHLFSKESEHFFGRFVSLLVSYPDFYRCAIGPAGSPTFGKYVPKHEDSRVQMYWNALLFFGKALHMDIPASEFLALYPAKDMVFEEMPSNLVHDAVKVIAANQERLTTDELNFLSAI